MKKVLGCNICANNATFVIDFGHLTAVVLPVESPPILVIRQFYIVDGFFRQLNAQLFYETRFYAYLF